MNAFSHATAEVVIRHGHMACGLGAGAAGMNAANPRVGPLRGRFECAGGIGVDEGAIRNFQRLRELRADAQVRADDCWRRHKAPMAAYWKVVSVYAGHVARVLR
ncbi:hypothetical protein ACMGDM_16490 [Sphingomonas sp. DT-51]|uniref:hypothetical protein n=1 Tax=Sphingomonas sp. DT-51 TaxID=3396165 RepID=UPI003F1AE7FC